MTKTPKFELRTDQYLTRRKREQVVVDQNGFGVFVTPYITKLLAWIAREALEDVCVKIEGRKYCIRLDPCEPEEDPQDG